MAASIKFKSSAGPETEKLPIVTFSQGLASFPTNGKTGHPSLKVLKHTDQENSRKRNWRVVVASGQKVDYVGRNHGEYAPRANSASKYFVGVLDKKTGKMKAYDAELFNLQPWIEREEGSSLVSTEIDAALSMREKVDRLTETFGSNKKKRALHSRLRNKVSDESLEKTATIAAGTAKDIAQPSDVPDSHDFELIPPCNKEASVPSDIYKLEDLLSETLMADLEKSAHSLISATEEEIEKWKKEQSYPLFILGHLPLRSRLRGLSVNQNAAVLSYIHILMQIAISRKRAISSFTVLSDIPHSLKEHIVNMFFQETSMPGGKISRVMTKLSKDKMMIHILILALHIDNFSTSLSLLQKDLGVAQKKMHQYVRSFGAQPTLIKESKKKGDSTFTARSYKMILTAPLKIVTRKPMRPKRR